MDAFLAVLSDLTPPINDALPETLEGQLQDWAQHSGNPSLSTAALHLGLTWWSRLHGLISLELNGHPQATGINPRLLYQTEVQTLLRRLEAPRQHHSKQRRLRSTCKLLTARPAQADACSWQ